jgi:hypothetical protein
LKALLKALKTKVEVQSNPPMLTNNPPILHDFQDAFHNP